MASSNKTWKGFTRQQIVDFCNAQGARTFSLQDFYRAKERIFKEFKPDNHHREEKVRQTLQYLRDDGFITFLDNSGHYTLRDVELLDSEKEEMKTIDLRSETPKKREYIMETYIRDTKWAKQARETFGHDCMYKKCDNSFLKENGKPYIEVHHILPMCEGGENAIWNLSVLCAHHHRMAHFADSETCLSVKKYLEKETQWRIANQQ